MKHILYLALTFLSLSFVQAQHVEISDKAMSAGVNSAFTVSIDNSTEKVVQKEWQAFLKEYSGRSKRDRKSGEIRTTGAAIGGIGGNANVFATSMAIGSRVNHTVWFESDGTFISPDDDQAAADVGIDIMEQFILHMKRTNILGEIKTQEVLLKSLQKTLTKEQKNEQRQHDIIAKAEKQIEAAKAEIEASKQRQTEQSTGIETQQGVIEAVKIRLENVSLESDDSNVEREED